MAKLQAIRGMHDILMQETSYWQFLEAKITEILCQYGYQEIRFPIVEETELFTRSLGNDTDIVSKEMYSFKDRNKTCLTLRPEGTASCVRAGIEHGLFHNQTQRLWYCGPMFRHERPQKGRQRQFHQIGVEAFGLTGPDIDAEHILMCARIWKSLNLKDLDLEINSLGTPETRLNYRKKLMTYFSLHKDKLDKDSLIRLERNPLRILDSKNPDMTELIKTAPSIEDDLDMESAKHFAELRSILDAAGIAYTVNPRLVRGLDYYNKTVFEWFTNQFDAQGTICAGGRYDGLVEYHGANSTPAVGFAIGMERLIKLLDFSDQEKQVPHIYLILAGDKVIHSGMLLAEELRNQTNLRILTHCGGGSFKSQFKKADKSGAELALVLGENELEQNQIIVKFLRSHEEQITIKRNKLIDFISKKLPV